MKIEKVSNETILKILKVNVFAFWFIAFLYIIFVLFDAPDVLILLSAFVVFFIMIESEILKNRLETREILHFLKTKDDNYTEEW